MTPRSFFSLRIILGLSSILFFFSSSFGITNPLNLRRACKAKNDSDIVLKWNIPTDGCNSFKAYYIYGRNNLSAAFDTIDSVTTLSQNQYIHKGAFLVANSWQYYVVIHYDCNGFPTLSSDTITIDFTQTFDQYIDSVSVDPISGKYIIGWKANTSSDIAGYKLYSANGTGYLEIADVDQSNTLYTDAGSSPGVGVKTYAIAAYDSCNNITAIIDKHTPIKVSVSFDSCSRTFSLAWSKYIGFPLSKYEILVSSNGLPYYTIRDFLNVTGTLSYGLQDTVFHDGDQVCFRIRAINANNANISSTSNTVCLTVKFISLPLINYISQVNVVDTSTAIVTWVTDAPNLISQAILLISIDGFNYRVKEVFSPGTNVVNLIADSLSTSDTKYYFKVVIFNTCLKPLPESNISNSILLVAQKGSVSFNLLNWSDYLDFDAGVEKYEIYQGTGDPQTGHSFNLLASVSKDTLKFTDTQFPENIMNDGVCYYVVAYENPGNQFGVVGASSKSNEVCVPGDLIVFFPTAFNPNSFQEKNQVFKPRGLYIDYSKSWMEIYNRWGELVFETKDIGKGWDGKDSNGEKFPEGVYICSSYIASLKGKNQYYNGFVTLIR